MQTPEGQARKAREDARREEEFGRRIEEEDARIQAQSQVDPEPQRDSSPAPAPASSSTPAETNQESIVVPTFADAGNGAQDDMDEHDNLGINAWNAPQEFTDGPEHIELSTRPADALDIRVPDTRSPAVVRPNAPESLAGGGSPKKSQSDQSTRVKGNESTPDSLVGNSNIKKGKTDPTTR